MRTMTDLETTESREISDEHMEVFDDGAFMIHQSDKTGLWKGYDKDGHPLVTSYTKEDAIFWSRNHLFGPLPGVTTTVTNIRFDQAVRL